MTFRYLELNTWRQFQHVKLDFHDNLTILTGANGSGKTTILNILGYHYNWHVNFVSTPQRDKVTGIIRYLSDAFAHKNQQSLTTHSIGQIAYTNGSVAQLQVPAETNQQYSINITNQQTISGLHIPSHRPTYSYQPVTSIPTQVRNKQQSQITKESLMSLAIFGTGNDYVKSDENARLAFKGFQEVLKKVLPPKLGFKRISIEVPEVLLETDSGNFSLDAVSGGVASILDMAWRIFMYSPEGNKFVCTIDEPENHLHPELQQSLLPNLINAFANVQFIIATHNPFMISAVYDSNVYILDYNQEHKVESEKLETVDKAGTANEILRDVLGLPFTIPLWAEAKLKSIVNKYAEKGVSEETIDELEAELAAAGLENIIGNTANLGNVFDSSNNEIEND
ncbi:hypothetical protein DSM106972_034090 [Dulcicalothrix desertica PCC 7102]|uniref:AAA+ ATPase domain-containing protein n=1 Tax=Dulcicalothrix desertica PCC 7102 TaxID=232991 RepID=A0A3S1CQ08_9CYAN|nr:AAA family ATPase [Dulcicalothrix desertica]RUT06203.1 hypothetical protein DSM106972_034090 [Dulcicalothrix desertica PCC 7102]TWH54135.1 putative ATP-binding protein involved in virulence [Dulcicalothrix desertica PCC 7102]